MKRKYQEGEINVLEDGIALESARKCVRNDNEASVLVNIVDFSVNVGENFQALCKKMREKREQIPFSGCFNFEQVISGTTFLYPFDVKMCYSHRCIIVSDKYNAQFKVFDMYSKKFITSFDSYSYTSYFCIEEGGLENHSYIIFHDASYIYKYDLTKLIFNYREHDQFVWRVEEDLFDYQMDVQYSSPFNIIFVCGPDCMRLLRADDGSHLSITLPIPPTVTQFDSVFVRGEVVYFLFLLSIILF